MYVRKCRKLTLFSPSKKMDLIVRKKTMFEQLDFSKQMIPINSISANGIMRSFTELLNCKSFSKREGDYYVNNFRQKNKKCVKAPIRILQCHPILILDNCRGAIVICNSTSKEIYGTGAE